MPLGNFDHTVRMMPPTYVKAYVKRNKTDTADAEAICEAVSRPTMRFVPIKTQPSRQPAWCSQPMNYSSVSEARRQMQCVLKIVR
jgi:hypothetical protein